MSQTVRPIAVREWGSDYPVLHLTLDGKCPFIDDPSDQNLERKRLKRFKKFEATKSHRQALRAATERVISGVSPRPAASMEQAQVLTRWKSHRMAKLSLDNH